ncbi:MAG: ribonuclease H [Acidimicrobiales bacterium]
MNAGTLVRVDVFTDGACSGNPGPGGWAWVTADGRHGSGSDPETTNQRMELTAVAEAIAALDGPLAVHSDSTYVVNCFRDRWYEGWKARGWRNANRKPVANRDLWEPLVDAYLARPEEITFTWVKGHAGNRLNELADSLAVAALQAGRDGGITGRGPAGENTEPTRLPGDAAVARGNGPIPPWSIEQAVVVTGARELDAEQRETLLDVVAGFDPDNDVAVSGLRLGAELEGAELAVRIGVPLGVVLPFADPARRWSATDRARFDAAAGAARWTVVLEGDPAAPGAAISARNEWLWSAAVGAVVVGDDGLAAEAERAGLGVVTG